MPEDRAVCSRRCQPTGPSSTSTTTTANTRATPSACFAPLRAECPVAWSPAHEGFWIVSRYDDIADIAHRPEAFSSQYCSVPRDFGYGDVRIPPLQLDPPEHVRFKRLLATAFVPARIAAFEPVVRETAVRLIEGFLADGTCDASEGFARGRYRSRSSASCSASAPRTRTPSPAGPGR